MTENQLSVKKPGNQQTSSKEDLVQCIVGLTNAMKADFGQKFKSQFESEEALRIYKNRLYTLLKGHSISAIVEGYKMFIETAPEWPPEAPTLLAFTKQREKEIEAAINNKAEAERLAALPAPKIECNPLEMLAKAKSATSGQRTKEEEKRAREDALKNHNAVLNLHSHRYTRRFAQPSHYCAVPGCNKAGTISAGTNGGSNWLCAKHFRLAN